MTRDEVINGMLDSRVGNYAIPGLESALLSKGKVRLFDMTRHQNAVITPHSHRYALSCYVLNGYVENTIYTASDRGDPYFRTRLDYGRAIGSYYIVEDSEQARYVADTDTYEAGKWYTMSAQTIHSIKFSKCAKVIVFEGESLDMSSYFLEPDVYGQRVPTFKVEPWMFKRL